jgi:hypothetical protein
MMSTIERPNAKIGHRPKEFEDRFEEVWMVMAAVVSRAVCDSDKEFLPAEILREWTTDCMNKWSVMIVTGRNRLLTSIGHGWRYSGLFRRRMDARMRLFRNHKRCSRRSGGHFRGSCRRGEMTERDHR